MQKMKDSGVPWIGDIPEGWEVIKVKYCSYLKGRIGWQGLNSSEYLSTGAHLITGTDFCSGGINWDSCVRISEERFQEAPEIHIKDNDLLITKDGTIGKVALTQKTPTKASLNSGVLLVRTNSKISNKKYLYYILISSVFWTWFISRQTGNSTIQHLYQEKFKEFSFPLPCFQTQNNITDFLDAKCAHIDDTIAKEKELIEKLKEYRQSVITEAVTKGLNPNALMKDSGIDWIGEIPKHWEVKKLKYVFAVKKDIAHTLGFEILSVTQSGIKVKDISKNEGQVSMDYSKYQLVNVGEFIMNHMDLLTGWVDCSKYKGVTSPDYRVFKLLDATLHNKQFFTYFFQTCYKQKIFYGLGQGVSNFGRWRLPTEQFINFQLPLPPLEEQQEIASYLDQKSVLIDKTILQKEELIAKLNNYKKSLIYEAVTGKIEV